MFFFVHRPHLGSSMPHFRFAFTHSLHDLRLERGATVMMIDEFFKERAGTQWRCKRHE
jgi:hypothetical protein